MNGRGSRFLLSILSSTACTASVVGYPGDRDRDAAGPRSGVRVGLFEHRAAVDSAGEAAVGVVVAAVSWHPF